MSHLSAKNPRPIRVLLIPDWIQWVTGTLAKSIAQCNGSIESTIISAAVVETIVAKDPAFFQRFDIVHFTCSYAPLKWLPILRDQIPCVTSHHHVSDWSAMKHNTEGDAVVVASKQWEDDLQARGVPGNRIELIPYGVDTQVFHPVSKIERDAIRNSFGIPDGNFAVGFFAKRSSDELGRKGTDIFVQAILQLKRDIQNLSVVIVGPGWDEFITELRGSATQCIYFPFIESTAKVAEVYRALDFYWITSRIEGGPVPLLEAMSSGVCCVSTPVGMSRDIIADGVNGCLFPIDSPEQCAERTLELIRDRILMHQMMAKCRKCMVDTMDVSVVYKNVPALYKKAISNFENRTGKSLAGFFIPAPNSASIVDSKDVPLGQLDRPTQKRIRLLEHLKWAESLNDLGQTRRAVFSVCRLALANPASCLPIRTLARILLPSSVISRLVAFRRKLPSNYFYVAILQSFVTYANSH